jgi:fructose/tagatose bisphosphate aldolase
VNGRIVVHSLEHAAAAVAAAAELGVPLTLVSAPRAGGYAGPLWFKALVDAAAARHPGVEVTAILDCGDEPGTVLAALRTGLKHLRFTGADAARRRLAEIAAAQGAVLESEGDAAALDLLDQRRPDIVCRDFLAAGECAKS